MRFGTDFLRANNNNLNKLLYSPKFAFIPMCS